MAKIRWCLTLTYSSEHEASKVMKGMEKSQTRHVCWAYRLRLDNFGMDFVPRTTLYVNVRHHRKVRQTSATLKLQVS